MPVRADLISKSENGQVFFDDDYKIMIYNKAVGAKTIKSIFDWMEYTPVTIYDYFTTERAAVATTPNKHRGFGSFIAIGLRLYLFYRDGVSHVSCDGVIRSIYSDNNGETWSNPVEVYTGLDIIDSNPQILIDDPLATPDLRDIKCIDAGDGTILILGFAGIGHNSDENTRVLWGYKSFCLKIPYAGNAIDVDSKTIVYINDDAYSGGLVKKDNIIYSTTYHTENVKLYKSINYGTTWTYVSTIFSTANQTVSESTLAFVEDILYCIGRTYLANGIVCKSNNNGVNWTDYTSLDSRIDGLTSVVLSSGKIIVFGRNAGNNHIDLYKLNGLAIEDNLLIVTTTINSDCGYGNVIKLNGVYHFLYGKGPDADPPIADGYSYVGEYFKSIEASIIDNY
jgi:hypothetical protein